MPPETYAMRRAEKEIRDRAGIDAVIARSTVCHLALARDNEPYVIPVSFGYDGRCLYIHTAPEGKKIDLIRHNPRVAFAMECGVELLSAPASACKWSFAFESVAGQGRIEEVLDPEEKAAALDRIVRHYAGDRPLPAAVPGAGLRVWRIRIETISGKRAAPRPPQ